MARKKEIVINAKDALTRIAIVEDGQLAELFLENQEHERTIGDIHLGRVRRIMPSIQAAFVDIGQKQDAFLHFSDLSEHLPELLKLVDQQNPRVEDVAPSKDQQQKRGGKRRKPKHSNQKKGSGKKKDESSESRGRRREVQRRSRRKGGRGRRNNRDQADQLKRDQRILVKITKEPISNKGSRVSTDISLAGRFVVLVPFGDYVAVSKKITSYKERKRLKTLASSLLPDGFGLIVRTVAEGRDAKALDTDLRLLMEKWRGIEDKMQGKPKPPIKVHQDVNMVSSIMRDVFSEDFDRVLIDEPRVHRNVQSYIQAVAPQMADSVQLHRSDEPIFESARIAGDVAEAFQSRVELPSGGYLFIEQTEAMHVVDVNSGRSGKGMSQEESSLKCNIEAARMICRQMRLRDLGGIIVIDFIDLRHDRNRKKVYDELKKEFKKDRAVTKVLPMSDFGVVQITRQRLRPSITKTFDGPKGTVSSDDSGSASPSSSSRSNRSQERSRRSDSKRSESRRSDARRSEARRNESRRSESRRNESRRSESRRSESSGRSSESGSSRSSESGSSRSNERRSSSRRSSRSTAEKKSDYTGTPDRPRGRGRFGRRKNAEQKPAPSAQPTAGAKKEAEPVKERSETNAAPRRDRKREVAPKAKAAPKTAPTTTKASSSSSSEELVSEMESWIAAYRAQGNRKPVILRVHPFTAAFLNRKVPNYPTRWFIKHLVRVRMDADEAVSPIDFRFLDAQSEEDLTDEVAAGQPS